MLTGVISDVGLTKKTNQDAIFCTSAQLDNHTAVFGVICDGLGGLSHGEVASSNAIHTLHQWFQEVYPLIYKNWDEVKSSLADCLSTYNQRLYEFAQSHNIRIGTTISGVLILDDIYMTVNIGDSRVYCIRNQELLQLTKDHSFVQREMDEGRMTEEEASVDKRKNILTRCIGIELVVEADFTFGKILPQDCFFFCSDGARHLVTPDEFVQIFNNIKDKDDLKLRLAEVIRVNKVREERDNISIGCIYI